MSRSDLIGVLGNMADGGSRKHVAIRQKRPLADRVYHALFTRISNGDYPANQRLPSEPKLSEDLGVSRPVLRQALKRLRGEGVIYAHQGAGNFVRESKAAPVGFAKVETFADIQRIYEFRITIETAAASLAAERRNRAVLEDLREALEMMREATGSHKHREDADLAFHLSVTKAANNHYYESAMRALRDHINVGMKMHGQSLLSDRGPALEKVFDEHCAIFSAIEAGNPGEASAKMRAHLEHSRDRLFGGGLIDLRLTEAKLAAK